MKIVFVGLLGVIFHSGIAQHHDNGKEPLKKLDFLLGNWTVEVEARLSSDGPWEKSTGVSIIKRTLDSALVEEDFTGSREDKPFLSKALIAINNQTNFFQRAFIDSPHGTLIDFEGSLKNDQLVFDKTWTYASGSTVKLRVVYTKLSGHGFLVESMRMPQDQTTWDTTTRMKYSRKN